MNTEIEYLTKEKFDQLKNELEYLKHQKRTEIAASLEYAKSLGDLSENAEYHEARDAQGAVEDRINHLEYILRSATIIAEHDASAVEAGCEVTVLREKDSVQKTFTIVGSEEADAMSGKISMRSPLGVAILGKKKGDSFTFQSPIGTVTYKVVSIR
ncbi:MAG: transcription elongation factor GreA [bacterium]|nr:transcription elongation factor GreA [bacterium]